MTVWAVLLLACGGPGSDPEAPTAVPAPTSGTFSSLTYNVAGLPEPLSSSQPLGFTPLISPKLNAYDLVLVQEDFAYHHLLEAEAEHPFQSVPKEAESRPMADGLNRFSTVPFATHERRQWDHCNGVIDSSNDCLAEKGFATAVHTLGDTEVVVVNVHADAGGAEDDIAARADNYAQLTAWLDGHPDAALLVGGDTNLRVESRPGDDTILTAFLMDNGLTDSCLHLSCGEDHIDRWMFRSGTRLSLEPQNWRVADEMVDDAGNELSDHPAIAVEWSWSTD